jgi:hypothetical protein
MRLIVLSDYGFVSGGAAQEKWLRLFEQHFPIYKWIPGGLQKVLGAHRECHLMRPAVARARRPDTFHLA